MDIVEFLTARLNEREKLAHAACVGGDGRWHTGDAERWDNRRIEADDPEQFTIYDEGGHDEHQAAHIAYNDPAHVLAEVAAKRAIVEDCAKAYENGREFYGNDESKYNPHSRLALRTLRALAATDAEHPDYNPAWAVS